ncbi:MAG: caspase family protein, partial [Fimbriimonadaceae bacterium]|nr:caspase family protein [Fimbriimonadaceae bacterium]
MSDRISNSVWAVLRRVMMVFLGGLLLISPTGIRAQDDRKLVVAPSAKRVALVIGNERYADGPLKNPRNDANAVAEMLRRAGFGVLIVKVDCNRDEMLRAIAEFRSRSAGADVAVFFYSGHGVQNDGVNYLVPIGAKPQSESDYEFECVEFPRVLRVFDANNAKVNLAFLDACRDNPFARSFRSGSKGLATDQAPADSLIGYATQPGRTASDNPAESNGLYTKFLLRHLAEPGVDVITALERVRRAVRDASERKQLPVESTVLTGKVVLVPAVAPIEEGKVNPVNLVGRVVIRSSPEGAAISLDGKPTGRVTPWTYESDVVGGPRTVRVTVSKEGFRTAEYEAEVRAGAESRVS